ncbi:UPF0147 family protein [Halorutilales archaeon Cl-col2-1]
MSDEETLHESGEKLDEIIEDDSVPRNIRESLEEAQEYLLDDSEAASERAANAINIFNDVSNDPNLPMHTRTTIWNISGELEGLTSE